MILMTGRYTDVPCVGMLVCTGLKPVKPVTSIDSGPVLQILLRAKASVFDTGVVFHHENGLEQQFPMQNWRIRI